MIQVIDDFLPAGLVRAAAATWPAPDWGHWHQYDNGKRASKSPHQLPEAVKAILWKMAELDAGADCFPDLEFLHGAGMHEMPPGTSLGLHLDAECHPVKPWKRQASAVLYLDECDGGTLDLTDADGQVIQAIQPMPNRLALFATTGQYHRVTECFSVRRSLCLFFWSPGEREGHSRALFT